MMKRSLNSRQSGVALMIVLILITLMVIFTTAFSKTLMSSLSIVQDNEYSVLAFYVADSGLQYAIQRISTGNGGSFTIASPNSVIKEGDLKQAPDLIGEVSVVVASAPAPSTHSITATGIIERVLDSTHKETIARRILVAEVTYSLINNPGYNNDKGSVQVNYWYELNR